MGSFVIVFFYPFIGQYPYLAKIKEQVRVQNSFPVQSVKSFNISVLHWLTWLYELDINSFI